MLEFLRASSGKILVFVAISVSIVPDHDHSCQESPLHGQISANSLIGQLYSFDSFFPHLRCLCFFVPAYNSNFTNNIILAARPAKLSPIPKPSQVVDKQTTQNAENKRTRKTQKEEREKSRKGKKKKKEKE
jgi:hypothetical protein